MCNFRFNIENQIYRLSNMKQIICYGTKNTENRITWNISVAF